MSPTDGDVEDGAGRVPGLTQIVTLGRVSGIYGVRGWLRIHSYTAPRDNIQAYSNWLLVREDGHHRFDVEAVRVQGGAVLAKLARVDDRDVAREWIGARIGVPRSALPPCDPGEYYWVDLIGLSVVTVNGERLGRVDHLIATGVHDVIVLDGHPGRLIPFASDRIVRDVDLANGVIVVDWDPAYWD